MYDIDAVRRLVSKIGLTETLEMFSSPDFPKETKNALSEYSIFEGDVPNVSLISSLVTYQDTKAL